jgi:hypothetical protein
VALAGALLREGIATNRVSERTQLPFALVEFLAEHPQQPQCPEHAVAYTDPCRPWATMAAPTSPQHTGMAWARVRLLLAASLNLALALFSDANHHPVLVLVCLLAAFPAVLIALCYQPARPANRPTTAARGRRPA